MSNVKHNEQIVKIVLAGLIGALAYVTFAFLRIDIPIGTSSTAIHLGNAIVVLGALLIGGVYGGVGGAIGLSISDLFSAKDVTSAPKTFLMKFLIGKIHCHANQSSPHIVYSTISYILPLCQFVCGRSTHAN